MAIIYKRRRKTRDGKVRLARCYSVKFRDTRQKWRSLAGYTDAKASQEMGRKLDCLSACRAAGKEPEPEIIRWLEGLPERVRRALAKWGLLDDQSVAMSMPLSVHLDDYKQASSMASRPLAK